MKITLNETEFKKAIIMFLETKMSLKGSLDVELSTQGKGGQTILATVDLDSEDLGTNEETTKEVKEPKKEDKAENTSEKTLDNPDNDSSLFGSDDPLESEKDTPKEIATASPFGNF